MRAIFLVFHEVEGTYNGIGKKIMYQINAFKECGLDMKLCCFADDQNGLGKRMIDHEIIETFGSGVFAKIKKRTSYRKLANYILKNKISFVYIRYFHNANPFLISFLKKLHKDRVNSVMEIPTYPYDQEYKNAPLSLRMKLYMDRLFRTQLGKYLYRIVTFSEHNEIFSTKTLRLSNGIDFSQISMKQRKNKNIDCVRLIGVAEIHFWHGFDRILTGLSHYYKAKHETDVFFDIVGYGEEELAKLRKMANENHLEKYAIFHGPKFGYELDQLFEKADVGIGSLARHRSHITHIKPLKNREYAARGIPFVYSEIDDDFEQMPYIKKISADETPVDIEQIVLFSKEQVMSPAEIRSTIEHTLSWKAQMIKVVEALDKRMKSNIVSNVD